MFSHPQHGMPKEDVARLRREGGRWLRAQRERAGLSQKELADRLGSDYYSFVSQLEAGKGRVPVAKMELWAEVLGVPAPEFAKGILRFYDPLTFKMLFGAEALASPVVVLPGEASSRSKSAAPPAKPEPAEADLIARVNRLEALLMLKGINS